MIKIKFLRYDNSGTHDSLCEVPAHTLGMHPNYDTHSMTKRQRVWSSKSARAMFGNHIIQALLNDSDFMKSHAPAWAVKGLRKYTSNLYVSLYNSEDSVVPETPLSQVAQVEEVEESQPVVPVHLKKKRKSRKPKKVDEKKEKRISFKQLKTKINSKMKVIRALNHFEDPVKVRSFRGDAQAQAEKEHYDKVITQIFKSYKMFFEEVLESRNIGFYVSNENYNIPYNYHNSGLSVEYLLVDNKENVNTKTLLNNPWNKVTLSWFTNKKLNKEKTYYRDYETLLSTSHIGLALNNSNNLRKSEVKRFKTMRENTFSGIIDTAFTQNNAQYAGLIENFKLAKERIVTNKIEDDKLNDFIKTNIIPIIEPEFISNASLNLKENPFNITIRKNDRGYHSNRFEILEVSRNVDNFEKLEYRVEFFGNRSRSIDTADDAINLINTVLANNLRNIMDTFIKASEV